MMMMMMIIIIIIIMIIIINHHHHDSSSLSSSSSSLYHHEHKKPHVLKSKVGHMNRRMQLTVSSRAGIFFLCRSNEVKQNTEIALSA
eukprot:12406898-Karenia_brevis.AAC.2